MAFSLPKNLTKTQKAAKAVVADALKEYPSLEDRIFQQFLVLLHSRGIVSIDEIYEYVARGKKSSLRRKDPNGQLSDNTHIPSRWSSSERAAMQKFVHQAVAANIAEDDIRDVIRMVVRKEEVKNLEDIARLPNVSFDLLAQKVREYCDLPRSNLRLPIADILATRVCLIQHFISDRLDFIRIAKNYIRIIDLNKTAKHTIGPARGIGRVGGKAAGMILSNRVIEVHATQKKKKLPFPLKIPESYFIRADLYFDFMKRNGLSHYYDQKYKDLEEIRREYPVITEIFKNGEFSDEIREALKTVLRSYGKHPIIVRSSSLLEDNFGAAFCGKYRSIYLANQGSEKKRFQDLLGAITEVYASILHPDPINYRRKKNLLDYDEKMGILIQKVVGQKYGNYFFPLLSGVGYSRNEYRWSPRIKKEDGMLRLVMGLGTRAVDRVGSDYPRIVALTEPTLKPQVTLQEQLKYSQRHLDVINLKEDSFQTILMGKLPLSESPKHLDQVISVKQDGMVRPVIGRLMETNPANLCITFDKLFAETGFTDQLKWMLEQLQAVYECPVDIEFSCDGENLYLLQCRPLSQQIELERVIVPENIKKSDQVFSANREIRTGKIDNIDYIVYVPAFAYDQIPSVQEKQQIGRIIGALNHELRDKTFLLVGPGRWGSSDINLGVRVTYNDISHTKALIEVAWKRDGYVPEVSFGTHFFQDLIESQIAYLPLYPDDDGIVFNRDFLLKAKNALGKMLPKYKDYEQYVRVINIKQIMPNHKFSLNMDGETNQALAFFQRSDL